MARALLCSILVSSSLLVTACADDDYMASDQSVVRDLSAAVDLAADDAAASSSDLSVTDAATDDAFAFDAATD
jgi:hypothetical protein